MRRLRIPAIAVGVCAALLLIVRCGDPTEAPRLELPLVVDASGITRVTTDLGYEVAVTEVRLALSDVVFTIAGEVHTASLWRRLSGAIIPSAYAHPGHYQGGDVTGELRGRFVVSWLAEDGRELGVATLITGTYRSANFTFDRGSEDLLGAGDPLLGHTAIVSGTATESGAQVAFTIVVDSPEARDLVGAPFEATLDESAAGRLLIRFQTRDPLEGDTLFDGIDFQALDADGDGALRIEPDVAEVEDAYNAFRRVFQTHDHYTVHYQE